MQDQPVTTSAACEADRHHRCRGQVISLTGDRKCSCPCHQPAEQAA